MATEERGVGHDSCGVIGTLPADNRCENQEEIVARSATQKGGRDKMHRSVSSREGPWVALDRGRVGRRGHLDLLICLGVLVCVTAKQAECLTTESGKNVLGDWARDPEAIEKLSREFQTADPFPNVVIPNFFSEVCASPTQMWPYAVHTSCEDRHPFCADRTSFSFAGGR